MQSSYQSLGIVDEIDRARAHEYALLATLLSRSPDAELISRLALLGGDPRPIRQRSTLHVVRRFLTAREFVHRPDHCFGPPKSSGGSSICGTSILIVFGSIVDATPL